MSLESGRCISIGYCRVSAKDQKDDLKRQINLKELFINKKIIENLTSNR